MIALYAAFKRSFAASLTARAVDNLVFSLLPRLVKVVLRMASDIYRGSAFLNAVGIALENSRWVR